VSCKVLRRLRPFAGQSSFRPSSAQLARFVTRFCFARRPVGLTSIRFLAGERPWHVLRKFHQIGRALSVHPTGPGSAGKSSALLTRIVEVGPQQGG